MRNLIKTTRMHAHLGKKKQYRGQALIFDVMLSVVLLVVFFIFLSSSKEKPQMDKEYCSSALFSLIANKSISKILSTESNSDITTALGFLPQNHDYQMVLDIYDGNLAFGKRLNSTPLDKKTYSASNILVYIDGKFVNATLYCT